MPVPAVSAAIVPDEETTKTLWKNIQNITASNIFSAVLAIVISLVLI